MESLDDILLDVEEKMDKSSTHLHSELAGLRTGKASPSLVENVQVEYYGSPVPVALDRGYVTIARDWRRGDTILIDFPMPVRRVVADDRVVIGSQDGRVSMLRFDTGEQVWSYLVGSPVSAPTAVVDGWIVAVAEDGGVSAFGEAPSR